MKNYDLKSVRLRSGFLKKKYDLNRNVTLGAVYDRFYETGRIGAFDFRWTPGSKDVPQPHFFWDSDVAKWMEGAAYILAKNKDEVTEKRVDELCERIREHQEESGYFNLYHQQCCPEKRFTDRDHHELYCAGHLIEAAVALAEYCGKTVLLECMEKYVKYIRKVFFEDRTSAFQTPGHEEIEIALIRLYRYTKNPEYLDLCMRFLDTRGAEALYNNNYDQSHKPVREQKEAAGHAVRAVYLYTGMALAAKETGDKALLSACRALYRDITRYKMYITGGIGSTYLGEAFTTPYDLPDDGAYTETCAGIGLAFFCRALDESENSADRADTVERLIYNGILSGLSESGDRFFYENPLAVNLSERYGNKWGERRFPPSVRPAVFGCSCCPPNMVRFLASLENYIFGEENGTLYVKQYADCTLDCGSIKCDMKTEYPQDGKVEIRAYGVKKIALRIPSWCRRFTLSKPFTMKDGYAEAEVCDGEKLVLDFEMGVRPVYAGTRVLRSAGKLCLTYGPYVFCAEACDNTEGMEAEAEAGSADSVPCGSGLWNYALPLEPKVRLVFEDGGPVLYADAFVRSAGSGLYSFDAPACKPAVLRLIPYHTFANRTECDMRVWIDTL